MRKCIVSLVIKEVLNETKSYPFSSYGIHRDEWGNDHETDTCLISKNIECLLDSRRNAGLDDEGVGLSKCRKSQPWWIYVSPSPVRP